MTKKIVVSVCILFFFAASGFAQNQEEILFKLKSDAQVFNDPPQRTIFTIPEPVTLTKIMTYHWNDGQGDTPGTISLRNIDTGEIAGVWQVKPTFHSFDMSPGSEWPSKGDGPPFLYWTVQPMVALEKGTWEVLDSNPSTWANNDEMGNRGCAWVYGSVLHPKQNKSQLKERLQQFFRKIAKP